MPSAFYGTELVHSQVCQLGHSWLHQLFHKNTGYVSWCTHEYFNWHTCECANFMKQYPCSLSARPSIKFVSFILSVYTYKSCAMCAPVCQTNEEVTRTGTSVSWLQPYWWHCPLHFFFDQFHVNSWFSIASSLSALLLWRAVYFSIFKFNAPLVKRYTAITTQWHFQKRKGICIVVFRKRDTIK